jgi:hypothetical protein
MTYILSLDPAQVRDWSALSALKMDYAPVKISPETKAIVTPARFEYALVAMARKQGLPYDRIVSWAFETYMKPVFWEKGQPPHFILDSTGVGVAVRDMLASRGVRLKAITITSGNALTRTGPLIHVGKPRLIGKFLAAFDAGKVAINPALPMWPKLEREMLAFRAGISAQGNAKFEAEPGENDDMLFSLAQGVWYGEEILRGGRL